MKAVALLKDVEFHDKVPNAEPVFVSDEARVLRFALRPGQIVREHNAPHSPVIVTVLQGRRLFAGGDGVEPPFYGVTGDHALQNVTKQNASVLVSIVLNLILVGLFHIRTPVSSYPQGRLQSNPGQQKKGDSLSRPFALRGVFVVIVPDAS